MCADRLSGMHAIAAKRRHLKQEERDVELLQLGLQQLQAPQHEAKLSSARSQVLCDLQWSTPQQNAVIRCA